MRPPPVIEPWAGVVLAGGGGVRLGGVDKAGLRVAGTTFLERALAAVAGAATTVVVATPRATSRPVEFVLESPPGGGPAAGLLAAAEHVEARAGVLVVLAVDMPWCGAATVDRLLAALTAPVDGAVLDDGRPQPLAAAYRVRALLDAAPPPGQRDGLSVRRLVGGLALAPVPAVDREAADVDLPSDLSHETLADDQPLG